jgi:hypothetical protein
MLRSTRAPVDCELPRVWRGVGGIVHAELNEFAVRIALLNNS